MYPSPRRQPSPGHLAQRRYDEREAKRRRTDLYGGRMWYGGQSPAGQLEGEIITPLMHIDKASQKDYTPDPDHLYLNATLFGQQTTVGSTVGVDPTSSVPATFDQTYDKVLLTKPSDFKMAVVRFSVPISAVPIQYYPTATASVSAQVFDNVGVAHSYGPITIGALSTSTALNSVVYVGEDPLTNLPAGTPGYPNGAVAVWSVYDFITAGLNAALYQLTAQMFADRANNNWIGTNPGGPAVLITPGVPPVASYVQNQQMPQGGGLQPFMSFDPATNLFSLSYEQQAWTGTSAIGFRPAGIAALYFNYTLFQSYFSTFPGLFTQTPRPTQLPAGFDVQLVLRPFDAFVHPVEGAVVVIPAVNANQVALAANGTLAVTQNPLPPGLLVGDTVIISGIVSFTSINGPYQVTSVTAASFQWTGQRVAPVVANTTNNVAGAWTSAQDVPSYMRVPRWLQYPGQTNTLTQETETASAWSSFASLRLITSSVPVRPEYVPTCSVNPSGPGQVQSTVFFGTQTLQNSSGQYVSVIAAGGTAGLPTGLPTTAVAPTGTSTVNTQQIMIDFLPEDLGKLELRNVISYVSRETYRWVDLIGDNALQRFDVTAQWVDRFGNAYTLTVAPDEVFDVKFLFQHKYA